MKVLLVTSKGNISGIGRYVCNLAKGLKTLKVDVEVVTTEPWLTKILENGIKAYRYEELFNVLRNNYDIINVQHRAITGLLVWIASKKTKLVFTIQNPKYSDFFKLIVARDGVITCSGYVYERLVNKLYAEPSRIYRSFLSADTTEFFPQGNPYYDVAYIGRLSFRKGRIFKYVLEAVKNLGLKMVVAGGAGASTQNVTYLGYVKNVADVIRSARVVIGTATTVFEAFACSKPVVAAGRYGYSGIITEENFYKEYHTLFSDHYKGKRIETRTIETDLLKLLNDRDFYNTVAKYGYNLVREKFNHIKMAEDVLRIYNWISS